MVLKPHVEEHTTSIADVEGRAGVFDLALRLAEPRSPEHARGVPCALQARGGCEDGGSRASETRNAPGAGGTSVVLAHRLGTSQQFSSKPNIKTIPAKNKDFSVDSERQPIVPCN